MIDFLEKVPLFEKLSSGELATIEKISRIEVFGEGAVIFREDDPGDSCFVITAGEVRISKFIPNIGEEALAVLKPGDYFGEMALIDDVPRSAHAIANTDVALFVIPKTELAAVLSADRDLGYKFLWAFTRTLSRRLRETNEKIAGFLSLSGGF